MYFSIIFNFHFRDNFDSISDWIISCYSAAQEIKLRILSGFIEHTWKLETFDNSWVL